MRSFLFASAALCLTWGLSGCDAPAPEKPVTPPPVVEAPKEKMAPTDAPKEKMEPTPTPAPVEPPK